MVMTPHLPLLADANLHLGVAEEARAEGALITARNELDKAEQALSELRLLWPEIDNSQQGLLVAIAKPLSDRAKALARTLPRASAVSVGAPVNDPEQDEEPDE